MVGALAMIPLRGAVTAPTTEALWPGGRVPYRFDAGVSAAQQQDFLAAAGEWSRYGAVEFVPHTGEIDHVLVVSGEQREAVVGRQGGIQLLRVPPGGVTAGEMLRFTGHLLGFS